MENFRANIPSPHEIQRHRLSDAEIAVTQRAKESLITARNPNDQRGEEGLIRGGVRISWLEIEQGVSVVVPVDQQLASSQSTDSPY